MKTKLVLIVFAGLWFVLLCLPSLMGAQEIDSCWCIPFTKTDRNLDSVAIDTCNFNNKQPFESCDTIASIAGLQTLLYIERRYYAKGYWNVWFEEPVLDSNQLNSDSLIIDSFDDFDTNFVELRFGLKNLQQVFGHFRMITYKNWNFVTNLDTFISFSLYLDKYSNVSDVEDSIRTFASCDFANYFWSLIKVIELDNKNNSVIIYPNPITDYLYIHNQNYNYNNIIISSVTGEVLLTIESNNEEEQKINIQSLSPGIYFLHIGNVCKKFIVNR